MNTEFEDFALQLQAAGIKANKQQLQKAEEAWQKENLQPQSLLIQAISAIGGFFSALFGLSFFLLLGLLDAPIAMISLGSLILLGSLWVVQAKHALFLNAAAVAGELMGYGLLAAGIGELLFSDATLFLIFLALSSLVFFFSGHAFSQLIAAVLFIGSLSGFFLELEFFAALHFLLAACSLGLVWLSLKEISLFTLLPLAYQRLQALFTAMLLALPVFSLMITHKLIPVPYPWLAGLWILLAGGYFFWQLASRNRLHYFLLLLLALLPLLPSAGSLAGMLLLAIGFYRRHLLATLIGSLLTLYSFSHFYYDLQFSLLIKSGLLFLSGCWMLLLYYLLNPKRHA